MQDQHHLHAMSQPAEGSYAPQSPLPALHQHQNNQADLHSEPDYGQSDPQRMIHSSQRPAHEQYHPQVSGIYDQQTGQPLMSDMGEPKQDMVALPFPQPSLNAYGQPLDPQHPGHMESASSLGQQHGSCSGSEFPSNSPEGALSPGDSSRKPRGRPPGSRNRKTLLKEAGLLSDDPNNMEGMENHPLLAAPPPKKRGRPPGSKNKKTLEAIQLKAATGGLEPVVQPVDPIPEEAVTAAAAASGILEITPRPHEKVPGRRGRPPGSKNKRTLAMESLAQQGLTAGQQQAAMALLKQRAEQKRHEDEANLKAAIASGQKRRGRPPGSKNRPHDDGDIEESANKRQRGRPRGSKSQRTSQRRQPHPAMGGDMQNADQMGMAQASPQLMLGSGVLSDAVTAAMHAVQPGNMYWDDAAAQPDPNMSSQDMSADPDELHQDNGLPAQLADSFHNAGPHGEGNHVMHAHHDVPYSVSYTETMQQPLSPMVVGPSMDQHQKDPNHMAHHLNLHGENIVHG
ncbi:hypothetical protein ABBQ32_013739 [Trebouxia sp. C0010 RCD-2024]